MRRYLRIRPRTAAHAAFFCHDDGRPYLYKQYLSEFREGLRRAGVANVAAYGTRSMRRGGATEAARLGAQPHELKALGRWRSARHDTYMTYIEEHGPGLRRLRERLASA